MEKDRLSFSQRSDWTVEEIRTIYHAPLLELVHRGGSALREQQSHSARHLQMCHLISLKTGGCSEDCKYCSQSSHYPSGVEPRPFACQEEVLSKAREAIAQGATRICLGAAWSKVRDNDQFERVLSIVEQIRGMGAEVCCTLGKVTEEQADRLVKAGLWAYNHNLDSSRSFYPSIITTRSYEERLSTLDTLDKVGVRVCSGAILGMGETHEDRIQLLHTLATRTPHPESVPINLLIPMPGTPLADLPPLPIWEALRMIASARILMPKSRVRLSAGRHRLSLEEQALCFLAGANSIFIGDKLLTADNNSLEADRAMCALFGLEPMGEASMGASI